MNILIAGGTGFIGQHLTAHLIKKGHCLFMLTRNLGKVKNAKPILWNGAQVPIFSDHIDVVINLSGAPIAGNKWTNYYKSKLLESRIKSTKAIVSFINNAETKPVIFINASASGFYGDCQDVEITENTSVGSDFVAQIVQQWEDAANNANIRTVLLRSGMVLGTDGGVLPKMMFPLNFGFATYFGNGNQYFPWIHIDDMMEIIDFAIYSDISGPVNIVAPEQNTLKEVTKAISKEKHAIFTIPIPSFLLKLFFGERSFLLLQSLRIKPEKLILAGFNFKYSNINSTILNLIKR